MDQAPAEQSAQARLAAIEQAARESTVTAGLATALSRYELNPGGTEQITALLKDQVTVHTDAGKFVPMGPGMIPLDQLVAERLGRPEFGHFIKTGSRTAPALQSKATGDPAAGLGESLSASVVRHHHHQVAAAQSAQAGSVIGDPSLPFGLKAKR